VGEGEPGGTSRSWRPRFAAEGPPECGHGGATYGRDIRRRAQISAFPGWFRGIVVAVLSVLLPRRCRRAPRRRRMSGRSTGTAQKVKGPGTITLGYRREGSLPFSESQFAGQAADRATRLIVAARSWRNLSTSSTGMEDSRSLRAGQRPEDRRKGVAARRRSIFDRLPPTGNVQTAGKGRFAFSPIFFAPATKAVSHDGAEIPPIRSTATLRRQERADSPTAGHDQRGRCVRVGPPAKVGITIITGPDPAAIARGGHSPPPPPRRTAKA